MVAEAAETREWPDFVIQKVQSFQSLEDAARTCTLNKAWLRSWKTHPVLVFDRSRFRLLDEYKFLMLVTNTLERYRQQNLRITKLSLNSWPSPVKNCIETTAECGLERLSTRFLLCDLISLSPFKINSLRELSFFGGQFAEGVKIDVCCPILVSLKLIGVRIDECGIHQLISNCPLIETLIVDDCRGFKKIDVAKLEHIKEFKLAASTSHTVEIEAPGIGLVAFKGLAKYFSGFEKFKVLEFGVSRKFGVSQNVIKLNLEGSAVTNSLLDELLPRLPFLTDLTLKHCESNESMDITCSSLEKLSLTCMETHNEFKIGAPKLLFMEYTGRISPNISFTQQVDVQKQKSRITLLRIGTIYCEWLYFLRNTLLQLHQSEVVIEVNKYTKAGFSPENLQALCPLPCGQDVYLDITSSSTRSMNSFILEALLSICRPQYISAKGSWDFLVEELVLKRRYPEELGRKVRACCTSLKTKYWRCQLKEVEVGRKSENGKGKLQLLAVEDWIDGSADSPKQNSSTWITFGLKW